MILVKSVFRDYRPSAKLPPPLPLLQLFHRLTIGLNLTWAVNSVAHLWGTRPYDKESNPAENLLVILGAAGEGHHNYHHSFPHDYSTSEHNVPGLSLILNITTGWCYSYYRLIIPNYTLKLV